MFLTPLITDRLTARPPDRLWSLKPTYMPGIQLYTLRDMLEKDTEGTLAALARIGYTEVETHSTYGKTPKEFRAILDRVGLKAPSGHYDVPDVTTKIDQTIADAKVLGHKFVILPWLDNDMRSAEGFKRAAEMMNTAGVKFRQAGITFGYHNHDFEFKKVGDNRSGYDILLAETERKLVCFELDLFWIRKGGDDPLAMLGAHKGRFRLVHIKDMAADGSMVDVGQGTMDWATLLKAARKAGVTEYYVEHDEVRDGLGFAKSAFEVISKL
ncbi:MAG TPA: sugar phosphate isomerase/epimerase [Gemmatimonadales bacterium]|nr:sugar phosphate isomerase/epimerase [Gemmatimonadales bacterium]